MPPPKQPLSFDWSQQFNPALTGQGPGETLSTQLQEPLPGLDMAVVEGLRTKGIDVDSVLMDPERASRILMDMDTRKSTTSKADVKFLGEGMGKYLGGRFEQGLGQSEINKLGYDALIGGTDRKKLLTQVQDLRSRLPNPNETTDVGWLLDNFGMGVELIGNMTRSLSKGAEWGLAGASAGALMAPAAPVTAPTGAVVGATAGVLTRATQENQGSIYLQLIDKQYEMYPDLDNRGQFLSESAYDLARNTDERYTSRMNYTPVMVDVPNSLAKPIALGFGTVMGALDIIQGGWFAKVLGGKQIAQKLGMQAVRRVIESGSIRAFVARKLVSAAALGAGETATEAVQEAVGYAGMRVNAELSALLENRHDVSPEAKESFLGGVARVMAETGEKVGPAMFMLGGLGAGVGAAIELPATRAAERATEDRARERTDGRTDGYFEQDRGEDVVISDIVIEPGEILQRERVQAAAILGIAQSSNVKLPPLHLDVRADGTLFAEDPTAAAMVEVARDAGMVSLRAIKRDRTKGPADSVQASEVFGHQPLESEIAAQFPNDSVADVKTKAMILQLAASRDGLSVPQFIEAYFQEAGIFPQVEQPEAAPEPGVPALPTIDRAIFERRDVPIAPPNVPDPVESPAPLAIEPLAAPAPAVGGRKAMAMGRVLDMLDTGWLGGEWKTPSEWLADSGLTGVVDPKELSGHLGTEAAVPADAYSSALRRAMEEGPAVPIEPALPDMPPVTAAVQMDRMRAAEQGVDVVVPEGPVMSGKTYLLSVEADAADLADEFLSRAARNVRIDRYETTDGGVLTAPEHAARLLPIVEEERSRLEADGRRLRRANSRALMRQLEVADAEETGAGEIPYQEGAVHREDVAPAFDPRIPSDAPAVIYVDMDEEASILSGLELYNSAAATPEQSVSGVILRADEGVTIEEARGYALRIGEEPDTLPDDDPGIEIVPLKSDGEAVGAVEFDEQGKAILRAYEGFDFKSWIHGLSNVFRRMLPPREASIAARWAGAKYDVTPDGQVKWTWDSDADYLFASGFMKYLEEGRVSVPELKPIWTRLSDWTKASYPGNKTRLNRRVRKVYESILVDEQSPSLKAYQANIQVVGQVKDMIFRSPVSSKILRLTSIEGRDLTEEGLSEGSPTVFVEQMDPDGNVAISRDYKDVDSAVRDISGVPSTDNPATLGDASYRPFRAKKGAVSGFYGRGPEGDVLPLDAGPEGSVHVGGKPVDGKAFIADVISRLDEAGPLPMRGEGKLAGIVTSWRRYDYATELLASGVDGPIFQVLSRDIDTGRATEKRTRFDLNEIQRNKLVQRGWSDKQIRALPRKMKETVEVVGWKHKDAKKTWTAGELLSFNRHLRAGQNRATLLSRGMRDGPDGDLISLDAEDIGALVRAYQTIPEDLREFGNEIVDELMDTIHEKIDPVVRKLKRRGLGYIPYYWDLERAQQDRPSDFEEELDALDLWRTQGDAKMGVFEGMTQHRTRKSAPVVLRPLDFQLMRNIDWASMYSGFAVPLKAAHMLFNDPKARAAMERRMGKDAVKGLEKGLEGVARRWVDESAIDKTFQSMQRKVTVSTLGGNIPVWFKQTLSLPLYGSWVPPKYMASALMRSVLPGQFKDMRSNLRAFDPTFMARSKGFDISLQESLEKTAAGEAWGKRRVSEMMMKGLTFMDQRTVVVGSHAAYLQAIDQFRTGEISEELKRATQIETHAQAMELGADGQAEKAYQYANWVTVRSQPNFLPEHVSSFQRDRITRFLSMFSGYTNVAYNMLLRTRYRASQAKSPQATATMMKTFFWILIGNAAGVAAIDYLKQLWLGRAPSPEDLPSWLKDKAISSATGLIYFVRDATFALQNDWAEFSPSPMISAGRDIIDAVAGVFEDLTERGEVRKSTVTKTLRAAGYITGMPLYSGYRYGQATYDLFDPMTQ